MPDVFTEKQINPDKTSKIEKIQYSPFAGKKLNRQQDVGLLSSFVRDPRGIAIAEQHADEKILLFIRRHVVTNLPWLTLSIILSTIPFFLQILISPFSNIFNTISPTLIMFSAFFYYLIIFGFMFANFVTWFYDIGIVTEERSVDIDFYNISYVSVATARAQDLKDVRYFQRGIFESLFDYGDVAMAVESSNETLTFEKSPHPAEVVTMISGLIGGHQKRAI